MMNRKFKVGIVFTALFSFICAGAQTPATRNERGVVKKKVLYNYAPNEVLLLDEFTTNLKSSGNQFAAILEDTVTKENSLIINGVREVRARNLYVPYLNLSQKPEKIYIYGNKDEYYVNINGKAEGPYKAVWSDNPYMPKMFVYSDGFSTKWRDSDGLDYTIEDPQTRTPNNPVFTSSNGTQKVKFSNNYHTVTLNGNKFEINFPSSAEDFGVDEVFVSDDGEALFTLYYTINGGLATRNYRLTKSGLKKYDDDEEFGELFDNTTEKYGYSFFGQFGKTYDLIDKNAEWKDGLNFSFKDPTGRHYFSSEWTDDYVMIDNKRIDCPPPFYAFFDPKANTFAWVVEEDNALVMYTYAI